MAPQLRRARTERDSPTTTTWTLTATRPARWDERRMNDINNDSFIILSLFSVYMTLKSLVCRGLIVPLVDHLVTTSRPLLQSLKISALQHASLMLFHNHHNHPNHDCAPVEPGSSQVHLPKVCPGLDPAGGRNIFTQPKLSPPPVLFSSMSFSSLSFSLSSLFDCDD